MIGADPLCSHCWAKVPEKIKAAMSAAVRRAERAMTTGSRQIAEAEYRAAHDMALSFAEGRMALPTNTKASAAPPAPIAG